MPIDDDCAQVQDVLERLQGACETLAVRGLRAAGPKELTGLEAVERELTRVGATHLAGRATELLRAVKAGDRAAGAALLRTLVNLRLFERVLTIEAVEADLATACSSQHEEAGADLGPSISSGAERAAWAPSEGVTSAPPAPAAERGPAARSAPDEDEA